MSLLFNPKVSIIIPVYNGANFLAEAIDSALAQTYKNIEIIVVNDGSNDNGATESIAHKYGDKIKYYYKENGGVSSALNFGIQKMTGDWFSWLSHDDLYLPSKIEDSVGLLKSIDGNRTDLIIYSDGTLVKEDRTEIMPLHKYFSDGKVYTGNEAAAILAKKGTLCGCCLFIPKDAFKKVGLFNEELRYSQDSVMWFSLFLNGYSICSTGKKAVLSRVHKKQVTVTRKDLFYHDALIVAKILAPMMIESTNRKNILYHYTRRRAKYNCKDTMTYLINFAKENNIFSKYEISKLRFVCMFGSISYRISNLLRQFIMK